MAEKSSEPLHAPTACILILLYSCPTIIVKIMMKIIIKYPKRAAVRILYRYLHPGARRRERILYNIISLWRFRARLKWIFVVVRDSKTRVLKLAAFRQVYRSYVV